MFNVKANQLVDRCLLEYFPQLNLAFSKQTTTIIYSSILVSCLCEGFTNSGDLI